MSDIEAAFEFLMERYRKMTLKAAIFMRERDELRASLEALLEDDTEEAKDLAGALIARIKETP